MQKTLIDFKFDYVLQPKQISFIYGTDFFFRKIETSIQKRLTEWKFKNPLSLYEQIEIIKTEILYNGVDIDENTKGII